MCDFERPSAYQERLVTARLTHDCCSCGFPIVRGEVYEHASGVWHGRGEDFRRHLLCSLLEREQGECGCWTFGSLPEGFGHGASWVLKRAWATAMRLAACEECGGRLPYPCAIPLCDGCLSEPAEVA